jgi:hypothetical protein
MPTHAEIKQKLIELSIPPIDAENQTAIDDYLNTLSPEDRAFAVNWAAERADESVTATMEDLRRRL